MTSKAGLWAQASEHSARKSVPCTTVFLLPIRLLTLPLRSLDLPEPLSSLIPLFQALVQLGLQGLILLPKLLTQGLQGREGDAGKVREGVHPKYRLMLGGGRGTIATPGPDTVSPLQWPQPRPLGIAGAKPQGSPRLLSASSPSGASHEDAGPRISHSAFCSSKAESTIPPPPSLLFPQPRMLFPTSLPLADFYSCFKS